MTSSSRYPQSNGIAERCVGVVKKLWCKNSDKDGGSVSYRSKSLKSGYSPNQLMFGWAVRSKVGSPSVSVDYDLFEETDLNEREQRHAKWDINYRAKALSVYMSASELARGAASTSDTPPDSVYK